MIENTKYLDHSAAQMSTRLSRRTAHSVIKHRNVPSLQGQYDAMCDAEVYP